MIDALFVAQPRLCLQFSGLQGRALELDGGVQREASFFKLFSIKLPTIFACMLCSQSLCNGQESAAKSLNETKSNASSQEPVETDSEKQERIAADRFLDLLKKRPRSGTALDKVYGYHIQNGSLEKFCETLRTEATEKSSGEAWMLLGMVQMQVAWLSGNFLGQRWNS